MKTMTSDGGFQGDVGIIPVKAIPAGAKEIAATKRVILAHSETGHHHAADNDTKQQVVLFSTDDPMLGYLRVDSEYADVVHHREWHTHETWRLPKGNYEIRRQREMRPDGWTMVLD
jgi:hypothetical protein